MIERALAFEIEHGIHDMFERLGPCDTAPLRHMADQKHRNPALLCESHKSGGTFADLADIAWRSFEIRREDRLDRVHDHDSRRMLRSSSKNGFEQRFANKRNLLRVRAQPIGTEFHLKRRLLTRHVKRGRPASLELGRHLQQDRTLANPRLTTDKHKRSRDDTTAQHEIELSDPGLNAGRIRAGHIAEALRLDHSSTGAKGRCSIAAA